MFPGERWEDKELQRIKVKLNDTKNRLSELDIEKWHKHTQNTHRAGLVSGLLRNVFKPELCTQVFIYRYPFNYLSCRNSTNVKYVKYNTSILSLYRLGVSSMK